MEYRKLKHEQTLLHQRIKKLKEKDVPIVAGKVKASSQNFPYMEQRISVQMSEPATAARLVQMQQIYEERQKKIEQQMLEIEKFIDKIRDSETRQIFEMRFIEGRNLREIAEKMNQDRSSIGKKINNFLQLSHNSQKSVL